MRPPLASISVWMHVPEHSFIYTHIFKKYKHRLYSLTLLYLFEVGLPVLEPSFIPSTSDPNPWPRVLLVSLSKFSQFDSTASCQLGHPFPVLRHSNSFPQCCSHFSLVSWLAVMSPVGLKYASKSSSFKIEVGFCQVSALPLIGAKDGVLLMTLKALHGLSHFCLFMVSFLTACLLLVACQPIP